MKIQWSLWSGVALLALLDVGLCEQIVTFIDLSADGGKCGSERMWVATTINGISLAAVSVAICPFRSYFIARPELNPRLLFVARSPLICLVALLLTYFVVLKFIGYLCAY
jgi:hypothetical protein